MGDEEFKKGLIIIHSRSKIDRHLIISSVSITISISLYLKYFVISIINWPERRINFFLPRCLSTLKHAGKRKKEKRKIASLDKQFRMSLFVKGYLLSDIFQFVLAN